MPSPPPAPLPLAALGPGTTDLAPIATVLAHRLRSIIASVQGYAELLADSVTEDDRPLVLHILEGGAAVERILADLLQFGHEPEPLVIPVSVASAVSDLVDVLGMPAGRVRLALDVPAGHRHPVDPVLLRQSLLIVLQNAFEAGDGRVDVEAAVTDDGAFAVTVVNDADVTDAERMFEPFFTTKNDRLGLGLAIARRAAEAQGGSLTATSNQGQIRVTLQIPAPH